MRIPVGVDEAREFNKALHPYFYPAETNNFSLCVCALGSGGGGDAEFTAKKTVGEFSFGENDE